MKEERLPVIQEPARQTQTNDIEDYGYPSRPVSHRKLRNVIVQTSKRVLLSIIYLFMCIIGGFLWLKRLGQRRSPLQSDLFYPQRILVIRLDLIGDLVLSLPVVHVLKRTYPYAEIDLLAMPSSAKVVSYDPDLAKVITYDPNIWRRPQALLRPGNWREARDLLRLLYSRRYDLAVSVFGPWAAILAVLSGARRSVGFSEEGYPGLLTDPVPGKHWKPGEKKHEIDYGLELAQASGATLIPKDRSLRLYIDRESPSVVDHMLCQEHIALDKPIIACHVSSNNGQSKRWPIPYWARLLDRLIDQKYANVVLTGAPADLPLIEDILRRMRERPINMAGKTSLAQLAALLERVDLVISGDSGPMHMAAAVGTPLIAIFGPTDPAQSGPISPKATILRSDIWCSPCYDARSPADCRFYTTQCMKNITPEQVLKTIQEKLKQVEHTRAHQEAVE